MKKCDMDDCKDTAVSVIYEITTYITPVTVCERHKLEIQSELYTDVTVVPLNPEPASAYETLEECPDEASPIITAHSATLAERYGTPWPVSGDHVAKVHKYQMIDHLSSVAVGSGFL